MNNNVENTIECCEHNNIITTSDITRNGIHRNVCKALVDSGEYYRVQRGVYMRASEWEDEFYLLQTRFKRGIFSHSTALYLHGYSDRVPMRFQMTFPKGYNCTSLKNENVEIVRVTPKNYEMGITEIKTPFGNTVKIYDIERCLCDILRGKGEDLQIINAAMKKYILSDNLDINKLMKYAKLLRVETKVRKYMEVLL